MPYDSPAAAREGARQPGEYVGRAVALIDDVPSGTDVPGAVLAEAMVPLTPGEEAFARKMVLYRNATRAFCEVYDCTTMTRQSAYNLAYRIKNKPNVQRRLREIESIAARELVVDVKALLAQDLAIIAAAGSGAHAELSHVVRECCRYCHGNLHRYQWIDPSEFALKLAEVMEDNAERAERKQRINPMPTNDGGYGFEATKSPHSDCPKCGGVGTMKALFADTRDLSAGAALLYAGVKESSSGMEMKTQDVDKAKDRIFRALGLYGDDAASVARAAAAGSAAGAAAVARIHEAMTPDDAARAYLEISQA